MMPTRLAIKSFAFYLPYRLMDAVANRRRRQRDGRMLIVRHPAKQPYRYHYLLDWIESEFPEIRARMELRLLPCVVRDWCQYSIHIPWVQDPVEAWDRRSYSRLEKLEIECRKRGIPVINPVGRLARCSKSVGARLIREAGVRTPMIVPIDDLRQFMETLGGLGLPFLIREESGHGHPSFLVENRRQLERIPWARIARPVAAEFIDVRDPRDGHFRKYRYLAAGEGGVCRHLMVSNHWEARPKSRVTNASTREEELNYLEQPDPHAALFQRARRALGLDLIAFDYSYDTEHRLVVWEANPYPDLRFPAKPNLAYTFPYVRRSFAAVTRMYLQRAGQRVPEKLYDLLAGQDVPVDFPYEDRRICRAA